MAAFESIVPAPLNRPGIKGSSDSFHANPARLISKLLLSLGFEVGLERITENILMGNSVMTR